MPTKIAVAEPTVRKTRGSIKPVALDAPKKLRQKKAPKKIRAKSPCPGSRINIALLLKVKQAILDEPYRFNMGFWVSSIKNNTLFRPTGTSTRKMIRVPKKEQEASCGTAACIAGHAILVSGYDCKSDIDIWSQLGDPTLVGMKLLGLGSGQAHNLFLGSDWPTQFRDAYYNAKSFEERAQVAAARIDHFIATCGKE